jgi:hypothetical protein
MLIPPFDVGRETSAFAFEIVDPLARPLARQFGRMVVKGFSASGVNIVRSEI